MYEARDDQLFERVIALQQMSHGEVVHSGGRSEVNFPVKGYQKGYQGQCGLAMPCTLVGESPAWVLFRPGSDLTLDHLTRHWPTPGQVFLARRDQIARACSAALPM